MKQNISTMFGQTASSHSSLLQNTVDTLNNTATTTKTAATVTRNISLEFSIAFGSLLGAVSIVGVLANALVVLAVLGDRKMRKSPMNLLLLNLAIADLLYLLAFSPFWLSISVHGDVGWHFSDALCPIGRFLGNVFLVISILNYLAICAERYVAIVHPMHTSVWCTRSRVLVVALGIWVFAMVYQFPYLVVFQAFTLPESGMHVCRNPTAAKSSIWKLYKWSEFLLTYALPILLSVLMYSRICRVLWSVPGRKNNAEKTQKACCNSSHSSRCSSTAGIIKQLLEARVKRAIADVQRMAPSGVLSNNNANKNNNDKNNTKYKNTKSSKKSKIHQSSYSSSSHSSSPSTFPHSTISSNNESSSTETSFVPCANLRARRSVVKMLMLCVSLFFLCYTPMVAYFLWSALFGRPLPLPNEFVLLTSTMVQFQSAFNPFLYTLFATKFREKLAACLLCHWRSGGGNEKKEAGGGAAGLRRRVTDLTSTATAAATAAAHKTTVKSYSTFSI